MCGVFRAVALPARSECKAGSTMSVVGGSEPERGAFCPFRPSTTVQSGRGRAALLLCARSAVLVAPVASAPAAAGSDAAASDREVLLFLFTPALPCRQVVRCQRASAQRVAPAMKGLEASSITVCMFIFL